MARPTPGLCHEDLGRVGKGVLRPQQQPGHGTGKADGRPPMPRPAVPPARHRPPRYRAASAFASPSARPGRTARRGCAGRSLLRPRGPSQRCSGARLRRARGGDRDQARAVTERDQRRRGDEGTEHEGRSNGARRLFEPRDEMRSGCHAGLFRVGWGRLRAIPDTAVNGRCGSCLPVPGPVRGARRPVRRHRVARAAGGRG